MPKNPLLQTAVDYVQIRKDIQDQIRKDTPQVPKPKWKGLPKKNNNKHFKRMINKARKSCDRR